MEKISFVELATFCTDKYREAHSSNTNSYAGTLYVAIYEDNSVLCSKTPHVLRDCEKCILVHRRDTLAITNSYYWYDIEYIDEKGCVFEGNFGNGFGLDVHASGQYWNQVMCLTYNNTNLYRCKPPFEDHMAKIWNLYSRLKELSSPTEIKLIAELFQKDEHILELEKEFEDFKFSNRLLEEERNQYKELLDELKNLVDNNSPS